MDGSKVRTVFLARSEEGSATRVIDEAVLKRFDQAGLGNHSTVLAMLEKLALPEPNLAECRKAKKAAYKLLRRMQ